MSAICDLRVALEQPMKNENWLREVVIAFRVIDRNVYLPVDHCAKVEHLIGKLIDKKCEKFQAFVIRVIDNKAANEDESEDDEWLYNF